MVQVDPDAIVLTIPAATRQEILGFGAALTDASCFLLSQLHDDDRAALMHEIFDPGEMALNVCRTCIGSSDYSRSIYSFDDSDEGTTRISKKFSIEHDKAYILPVLRDARKLNPDLFLFSSPWSPPGWMKFNRSMLGGTIRKKSLEPYSRYILKFLDAYKAEGVAIGAITMQNEVDTTVDGRYPACQWSQEDEILFVRKFLGPLMRNAGCTTKIWVLDHNFNLWGRAIGELSNAAAYQYIDGVAWHGYAGEPSGMTKVHDAISERARTSQSGPLRDPDSARVPGSNPQLGGGRIGRRGLTVFLETGRVRSPCGIWRSMRMEPRTSDIRTRMTRRSVPRQASSRWRVARARSRATRGSGQWRITRNTCGAEPGSSARMEWRRSRRNRPRPDPPGRSLRPAAYLM